MFGAEAHVQFAESAAQRSHSVGSADVFLRVVVELRRLRVRCLADPIDIGELLVSVAVELLRDVSRVEYVRVVAVRTLLASILCSNLPQSVELVGEVRVVSQVYVACPVSILVVLEAAFGILGQRLQNVLVVAPYIARHSVALGVGSSAHGVGKRHVSSVGILLFRLREHARPVYREAVGKVMSALKVGGEDALRGRRRAQLVVLRVRVGADILGAHAVVVAHTLRVGAHVHVVPFYLVVSEREVELCVQTRREVVYAVVAVVEVGDIHSLFARRHLHRVVCTLRATEGVLHTSGKHHADTVFPEAVADAEPTDEVGRRRSMALHLHRSVSEVGIRSLIVGAERLVGRAVGIVGSIGCEIVSCAAPEVVAHAYGGVSLQLEARRRILHHHVDHSTSGIALHIGSKRLRHDESVHQIGRENVERNVSVLVVGARYLHTVHERIVVALVHAAEYGVRSLARSVALHGYARHTLKHARHIHVGRELNALLAHHVEHITRILHRLYGAAVGAILAMSGYYDLAQLLQVLVESYRNLSVLAFLVALVVVFRHVYHHLLRLVRHVGDNKCVATAVGQFVQREGAVESGSRTDARQLLHSDYGADERLACLVVLDNAVERMRCYGRGDSRKECRCE